LGGLIVAISGAVGVVLVDGSDHADRASMLQARVQAAVDGFLSTHEIPGASVAVIDRGQMVMAVSGFADLDGREPIQPDDEFRLASITKNYVAALAVAYDRAGIVRLDDRIGPWLPEMPSGLQFLADVTLRDLLSHTSGLAQTFVADEDRGRHLSLADVLDRIPPPVCEPHRCRSYADGNYVLAAVVLAAASGRTLASELQTRLLAPLDLRHTHFLGEPGVEPLPSFVPVVDPVQFRPVEPHRLRTQLLPIVTDSRASGMMATATDLAAWADALFSGRALGPDEVAEMIDDRATRDLPCPAAATCVSPYGLGVIHYDRSGHQFVGHDGSSGAIVATDTSRRLTIAILTNGGIQDTGGFLDAVVAAIDQP
jgi:D-alanyl-D-alanine carboxypeptidase